MSYDNAVDVLDFLFGKRRKKYRKIILVVVLLAVAPAAIDQRDLIIRRGDNVYIAMGIVGCPRLTDAQFLRQFAGKLPDRNLLVKDKFGS